MREAQENRRQISAICGRLFNPTDNGIERPAKRGRISFQHDHEQIFAGISGIERHLFELLEKARGGKIGIIALVPFAFSAEEDIRKRSLRDVIELFPARSLSVLGEHRREVGRLLREHEQFRMIIEECDKQRGTGFCLAGNETGALIERQSLYRHAHFARSEPRNQSIKRGNPRLNRVDGS